VYRVGYTGHFEPSDCDYYHFFHAKEVEIGAVSQYDFNDNTDTNKHNAGEDNYLFAFHYATYEFGG
jgi:hypothetical protein